MQASHSSWSVIWFVVSIQSGLHDICSSPNGYHYQPKYLSEDVSESCIGWPTLISTLNVISGALVNATGPGNQPAVWVQTANTVWFGSKPSQKPDPLHFGVPNPDLYPSSHGFNWVSLLMSVPISGSSLWVFLFMVASRYHTTNRKILTLVCCCTFPMYWPPL